MQPGTGNDLASLLISATCITNRSFMQQVPVENKSGLFYQLWKRRRKGRQYSFSYMKHHCRKSLITWRKINHHSHRACIQLISFECIAKQWYNLAYALDSFCFDHEIESTKHKRILNESFKWNSVMANCVYQCPKRKYNVKVSCFWLAPSYVFDKWSVIRCLELAAL